MTGFVAVQQAEQAAFFARSGAHSGFGGVGWRLDQKLQNLAPSIQQAALRYFGPPRNITWHRHANHGLSSQVCCLNFLMPLALRADVLSQLIGEAFRMAPPRMLPVEAGPDDQEWFVGFEWTGNKDYLGEWPRGGRATRGANATSADAVVRFEGANGPETVLVEWKYTESYGAPLQDRRSPDGLTGGNLTRAARYEEKAFDPAGPIRADLELRLEDFFWEPFYQLLRQQMLALQIEKDTGERTRVLHISPRENIALHKVTSPALQKVAGVPFTDAFDAFQTCLVAPGDGVSRFTSVYTEDLFGPVLRSMPEDPWASYILDRYKFDFLSGRRV
jgi:hypothetical protein